MNTNYNKIICEKITALRKKHGYTQEMLAEKLGITFQAVSKWETVQSCPDITLLPIIADIFGVHIDELFGRDAVVEQKLDLVTEVPWKDDNQVRAVVFKGRKLVIEPIEDAKNFTFEYKGEALNIETYFPIVCGDVRGNITANASVKCENVEGYVSSTQSITCANVSGDVSANGTVVCGNVEKGVSTNSNLTCGDVKGDVQCDGHMACVSITGDVTVDTLKCRERL